jgi:acetylglutamate kinase
MPLIKGGMIPKIDSCLIAIEKGVSRAHIIQGNNKESLAGMLSPEMKTGTTITG